MDLHLLKHEKHGKRLMWQNSPDDKKAKKMQAFLQAFYFGVSYICFFYPSLKSFDNILLE